MNETVSPVRSRFLLHGLGVEISCQIPSVMESLEGALGEFSVESLLTLRPAPIRGIIRPFNQQEVMRCLSPTATRIASDNPLIELYEEGERYWLIDDQWGLCEINLLKGQWRSWVLPQSNASIGRIVEQSVFWPIAQLLRSRGLCMIPAAGVVRDGWGALILSSFSIEPELTAMIRAGYRVIGQNWVAVREEEGRIVMLQMPGSVERVMPRGSGVFGNTAADGRIDLTAEYCGSQCSQADCDTVLLVAAGRRPVSHIRPIEPTNAASALRYAWPITELHPLRRPGQLSGRIAHKCKSFDVQLSRNSSEVLKLLDIAQARRSVAGVKSAA